MWLFIATAQSALWASHVLGGEITYKRISGNSYQFQLAVYRNCTECEFNTLNCPNIPDLDVLGAPGTLKAGQKLGSIALTRVSRKDITPVCNAVVSACGSNPGINTGMEAWVFTGSYDFTSLLALQCSFHVGIRIDSRTDAWGTAEYFYNFTALELCNNITNNSAQLNAPAFFILAENEPFRYNPLAMDADGDSLSYRLAPAQKGYERNLLYPSGLSALKPLTVYCGSGVGCPDNPAGSPPTGLLFDSLSGDLTFTPLLSGTMGFMVLEVLEWRKIGGNMVQVGRVRRDVQFMVVSVKNAAPTLKISGATSWLCAGDENCFELYGSDPAFLGVKDSMVLHADADFSGYQFTRNHSKPGSADASFCWTPQSADVRNQPYRLTFYARDQACPLNLSAYSSFRFRVAEKVKAAVVLTLDTCATLTAVGKASPDHSGHLFNWFLFDEKRKLLNQAAGAQVHFRLPQGGRYVLRLELMNAVTGCMSVAEDSMLVPAFTRPLLSLSYPDHLCPEAAGRALASVVGGTLPLNYLWNGLSGDSASPVRMPAAPRQKLSIPVQISDQIGCMVKGQVLINPFPFTDIMFRDTAICSSASSLTLQPLTATNVPPLQFSLIEGNAGLISAWPNTILEHQGQPGVNKVLASYTDNYGCLRSDTSIIEVTQLPVHGFSVLAPICQGLSMIDLRRESGLRLPGGTWFLDKQKLSGDTLPTSALTAGTYQVRYFWRGGGCLVERILDLKVNALPVLALDTSLPAALCGNLAQTQTLSASPAGGTWYGQQVAGNQLKLPQGEGRYLAVYFYQDPVSRCADTVQYQLATFLPPVFTALNGYRSELCAGDALNLSVASSHSSSISYSSSEEDGLSRTGGTQTRFAPYRSFGWASLRVVAHSENVCPDKDTLLQVLVKPLPTARISSSAWEGCAPFEALLQVNDFYPGKPDVCSWQPAESISSLGNNNYRFVGREVGRYPLRLVLQRDGCTNTLMLSDTMRVHASPVAAFDVLPGTVVDWEYPTVTLRNGTTCADKTDYSWYIQGSFGWQLKGDHPMVNFPAPGLYDVRLRATSARGCMDEITKQVKVNPPLRFYVPDAFTPDGRLPAENNEFKVSLVETVADYSLEVFNRWGQKVFVAQAPETGWNGRTPDGNNCPAGPYAWSLRFRTASGREVAQQGTILLLR